MGSGLVRSVWMSFCDHDVLADHATRFADVELVRPVVGVDELVLATAPLLHRRRAPLPGPAESLARK